MKKDVEATDWSVTRGILLKLEKIFSKLKFWRSRINFNREEKYPPAFVGWCSALVSALLVTIMLFVPPYLGMADDGTFARVANPLGIFHLDDTSAHLYFNYYTKDYLLLASSGASSGSVTSLRLLIIAAKWIDTFFTRDNLFDIRFLALLYMLLFVPALALLIRQAAVSVKNLSERIVIGVSGIFIFADVSYVTYFSSFYTEPFMYICFLLCAGSMMALQESKHDFRNLLLFTAAGVLLATAKNQCAVIGALAGIFCVRFIFINKRFLWRAACSCSALLLFLSMMFSAYIMPTDFTKTSKYHAMTRGVLLESRDPEKALAEFGIDPSYAVLSGANDSDSYPFIDAGSAVLEDDFYSKYDAADIAFYYLRHPKSLIAMLDISVKSALDIRRRMSGNYEISAGMPKIAKSPFWAMWSFFKANSIPSTIGFIFLLLIAVILLFRRPRTGAGSRRTERTSIPLETMLFIFLAGMSQAVITIVNSADAEMPQHLFLFSVSIDLLIYFCFAKILHKLNAF